MYYKEVFVGVVGMDFDYAFLAERVHEVEVYENGFAHLEIDGEVVCIDDHVFEDGSNHDKDKYLSVSKALKNGMSLVVSANYDDIRQIRYEICLKILWVVLILSAVFTVLTIMVVRKIVSPLKKITDAATKLSNGDYNVEFVPSNVSEIELLNTAFENMALNLHEREKELRFSAKNR
jgi:methyl-accepting chemotaxis protein